MKRWLILLLLLLCVDAKAEAIYLTRRVDPCFHATASCAGEGAVPLSLEAAQAFEKQMCPLCLQPRLVSREGGVGVFIPDAWVNGQKLLPVLGEIYLENADDEAIVPQILSSTYAMDEAGREGDGWYFSLNSDVEIQNAVFSCLVSELDEVGKVLCQSVAQSFELTLGGN